MKIEHDVSLAPLTTIRLGGKARYFVRVRGVAEIQEALLWARTKKVPWHILSGGSNTIFLDEGFVGLIIAIELKGIAWGEAGLVKVAAGEPWDPFVVVCISRDLAGVECLSGIPGLTGATPIQNVGAYGQEVSQTVTRVYVLEVASGEEKSFANEECAFAYRWSRFKGEDAGKYIVTAVEFQLRPKGKAVISYQQLREALGESEPTLEQVREAVVALRRKKSMVLDEADPNTHSCGSFFENIEMSEQQVEKLATRAREAGVAAPVPTFQEAGITRVPTAWLIEYAGFPKGFRQGGGR